MTDRRRLIDPRFTLSRPTRAGANQGEHALSTRPYAESDEISVHELSELRIAGSLHYVLDVREADELAICRLEGSLYVPMSDIPARIDDLPRDHPLVVVCHHGARSRMVVDFLRNAGFDNAVNLDGGIEAWACEIDPSMNRY
jgi:rhodanese-related sulfurtransferase